MDAPDNGARCRRGVWLKAAFPGKSGGYTVTEHPTVGRISEQGWSMVKRSANRRSRIRLATLADIRKEFPCLAQLEPAHLIFPQTPTR
jgi:hypothetical protein